MVLISKIKQKMFSKENRKKIKMIKDSCYEIFKLSIIHLKKEKINVLFCSRFEPVGYKGWIIDCALLLI